LSDTVRAGDPAAIAAGSGVGTDGTNGVGANGVPPPGGGIGIAGMGGIPASGEGDGPNGDGESGGDGATGAGLGPMKPDGDCWKSDATGVRGMPGKGAGIGAGALIGGGFIASTCAPADGAIDGGHRGARLHAASARERRRWRRGRGRGGAEHHARAGLLDVAQPQAPTAHHVVVVQRLALNSHVVHVCAVRAAEILDPITALDVCDD
jgi:hypothetical protein